MSDNVSNNILVGSLAILGFVLYSALMAFVWISWTKRPFEKEFVECVMVNVVWVLVILLMLRLVTHTK